MGPLHLAFYVKGAGGPRTGHGQNRIKYFFDRGAP